MKNSFIDGNEAAALGALEAGCNFFAGYPITPATSILNHMLAHLPPRGGVCLQGEDEIASIGYCLGASMAGKKAMTATSGPGISLYSENISFAIGSEIPLVIVDVQRLGPSTGSATKGADGDINFLRWGNTGGLPVYVLAPEDVRDCYLLTARAFNIAEELRIPVFVASNKEIALTRQSIDIAGLEKPVRSERRRAMPDRDFLPFEAKDGTGVPDFLPIGSDQALSRQTSSTHGVNGYITVDPYEILRINSRLQDKVEQSVDRFTYYREWGPVGADTLIITYGASSGAAGLAAQEMNAAGGKVSVLVLKTLFPVCETLIQSRAAGVRRVVVAEMNQGQYVNEIRRVLPNLPVTFAGRMNGVLMTASDIMESIKS